jgi:hypothetical protein
VAVYEGARPRTIALPRLPRLGVDAPAPPRRRLRPAVRARRRASRIALVLGAIVIAFVCAFFSLSQDIRVSEMRYQADRLSVERGQLEARSQDIQNDLNRLAKAPAVRKQAIDAGLVPLTQPLILPAR